MDNILIIINVQTVPLEVLARIRGKPRNFAYAQAMNVTIKIHQVKSSANHVQPVSFVPRIVRTIAPTENTPSKAKKIALNVQQGQCAQRKRLHLFLVNLVFTLHTKKPNARFAE
jgi:hypothetical protein